MLLKKTRERISNFFIARENRRLQKQAFLAELAERKARYSGYQDTIHVVEPGNRKFLERNSSSYFDLEYKYGTHVWVYVAINIIAEKSSIPDLVLMDEGNQRMENVQALPSQPNPVLTWDQCEQLISIWLELTGNAYIFHDKEDDTYWPLRPSRVKIVPGEDSKSIQGYAFNRNFNSSEASTLDPTKKNWMYDDPDTINLTKKEWNDRIATYIDYVEKGMVGMQTVKNKDEWVPLEVDEVLHFKYVSPTSDLYGISPLYPLLRELTGDLYARQWNKSFFENGAMPPGVLVIPTTFPADEFASVKKRFYDQFGGPKNRGKPFVLQGGKEGATYVPFPNQHRDLEFLNLLHWGRDELLAVFGVPHIMANAQLTSSHSSTLSPGIRELRRIFWQDTIFPKQEMKAQVWNKHFGYDPKTYPRLGYDYESITDLKPDWPELAKAGRNLLMSGMTVQEVRSKVYGLPEDWDGDLFIPSNVTRLTN